LRRNMRPLIICVLAVLALALPAIGADPIFDSAIAGGTPVKADEYKYVVALYGGNRYRCTGVIINATTVLSTATCLRNFGTNAITVVAGITQVGNMTNATKVESSRTNGVSVHPQFDNQSIGISKYSFNIGVVRLSARLYPDAGPTKTIGPAELQTTNEAFTGGEVVGWGKVNGTTGAGRLLTKSDQTTVTNDVCIGRNSTVPVDTDYHVCATNADNTKNPVDGDWGAPLLVTRGSPLVTYVYGLMYAVAIDQADPIVYVRVAKHKEWITGHP